MTSNDFCTVTVLKKPCLQQCNHIVISSRKKSYTFVQEKNKKTHFFTSADQKTQSDVPVVTRDTLKAMHGVKTFGLRAAKQLRRCRTPEEWRSERRKCESRETFKRYLRCLYVEWCWMRCSLLFSIFQQNFLWILPLTRQGTNLFVMFGSCGGAMQAFSLVPAVPQLHRCRRDPRSVYLTSFPNCQGDTTPGLSFESESLTLSISQPRQSEVESMLKMSRLLQFSGTYPEAISAIFSQFLRFLDEDLLCAADCIEHTRQQPFHN